MSTKKQLSATEYLEKKYGRVTFGKSLWAWRKSDEFSQTAFAKKLGISVQNLNDLEKGRKIPSVARAAKIARKLNELEIFWVSLAIRDQLYREGLKYKVHLESA